MAGLRNKKGFTRKRDWVQLWKSNKTFKEWYNKHYGIMVQLLWKMEINCREITDNSKSWIKKAEAQVKCVELKTNNLDNELKKLLNNDSAAYGRAMRRTFVSAVLVNNGFKWKGINNKVLEVISQNMHRNLLDSPDMKHQIYDLWYWYESFSRCTVYDTDEAIQIISDYYLNDYNFEFILSYLTFLRVEKGLSSIHDYYKHVTTCTQLLPQGARKNQPKAVYYGEKTVGCPIVPFPTGSDAEKDEILRNCKRFNGVITEIISPGYGKVNLYDFQNVLVQFTPTVRNKEEFKKEDENTVVNFVLTFSYSELKAWDLKRGYAYE